ncbi:kinase-like protein [Lentinula edodes]|uniref:Kinase-like protein n=1 Tax=Lentinula edodes TaxID=5353 RepID=A0A1Q3EKA0_LENED|nr:kinase-like protein [Lentinula edodes]
MPPPGKNKAGRLKTHFHVQVCTGSHHLTFIAQMSRSGKKLVRVESIYSRRRDSGSGLSSPSKMPSEIATMRYLKDHSTIPIPRIHGYDADADRHVGGTWLVMEYV